MCADFLSVSNDNLEVKKYSPEAEAHVLKVIPRSQDTTFAANLAAVVASHARSLAAQVLGVSLTPYIFLHDGRPAQHEHW